MSKWSLKTLRWMRDIIIIAGIAGGLILWLGVPSIIQNNRLVHAGNGQYGFKLGLLILLIVPLFALLPGNEHDEIHTDDEAERTKVEEEMKRATLNRQVCIAIGCSIVLLGSMLAAILFC